MKKTYLNIERKFEILTGFATKVLGNSIVFILAFCLVIFWWSNDYYSDATVHQIVGDIIFGITFLSLFIIQKSFNRYSALIHLKMNELISSHEYASNSVMNTSDKTEREITKLHEEYIEIKDSDSSVTKKLDNTIKDNNVEN